jgi:phosphatidate cytidylyltransferase
MKTRAISAVVAILILTFTYMTWRLQGLYAITSIGTLGCIFEYSRLRLRRARTPLHLQISFMVVSATVFFVGIFATQFALPAAAVGAILLLGMVLPSIRRPEDIDQTIQIQSASLVGLLYTAIFPAFVVRTLSLENGTLWLFGLLAIVFSGDTFAYLTGTFFGKTKLLEPVSPKKTIEGSLGGLFGSGAAGLLLGIFFLREVPLLPLVLTALVSGAFAQIGDLFESLLKRLAEVKDSGRIMPGHGGFLDRLDGILFAAPVYYVLICLL